MEYIVYKFANVPCYSGEKPTVELNDKNAAWPLAYTNWLEGLNPTPHQEWKKGVYVYTKLKENET